MITMNREVITLAESEITTWVMEFSKNRDINDAEKLAKLIVSKIDWKNSALMHKGLSWITKNYLVQNKLM